MFGVLNNKLLFIECRVVYKHAVSTKTKKVSEFLLGLYLCFLFDFRWRTKQNLDFSFLMLYAQDKGTFYVQVRVRL